MYRLAAFVALEKGQLPNFLVTIIKRKLYFKNQPQFFTNPFFTKKSFNL